MYEQKEDQTYQVGEEVLITMTGKIEEVKLYPDGRLRYSMVFTDGKNSYGFASVNRAAIMKPEEQKMSREEMKRYGAGA